MSVNSCGRHAAEALDSRLTTYAVASSVNQALELIFIEHSNT